MNARTSMSRRRTGLLGERGVATLEFAICAPLLLLLMLATAEIGRLLFQYNTLTKAVRDGARYAADHAEGAPGVVNITSPLETQTINLVVKGNTAGTGPSLLPGTIVVSVDDADEGFVSVSATYQYTPMLGGTLPTFGFGEDINLTLDLPATIVMRAL